MLCVIRMYMWISSLRFLNSFWSSSSRGEIAEDLLRGFEEISRESLLTRTYLPLRGGIDLIVWLASESLSPISRLRILLRSSFGQHVEEIHTFLTIYRASPYLAHHQDLRENIIRASKEPLRYLIAYPMKKSPEWYLLPFKERVEIMAEHASMARSLSSGKKIRSYTTYSYGIDDNEFLVIYEVEDLAEWSVIVERLREARHRKWIVREEPLLVGELLEDIRSYIGGRSTASPKLDQ